MGCGRGRWLASLTVHPSPIEQKPKMSLEQGLLFKTPFTVNKMIWDRPETRTDKVHRGGTTRLMRYYYWCCW